MSSHNGKCLQEEFQNLKKNEIVAFTLRNMDDLVERSQTNALQWLEMEDERGYICNSFLNTERARGVALRNYSCSLKRADWKKCTPTAPLHSIHNKYAPSAHNIQ